jgi:glycosyltransferase involved in cell wall biosynthesis
VERERQPAVTVVTIDARHVRLTYLTQYFPPETNAPAVRVYESSRVLVAHGHEVHVVTAQPNHPSGVVFPGFRAGRYTHDEVDGIHVHRVPTLPTANRGTLRRSLQFLEVAAVETLLGALRLPEIDLVLATSPQLLIGAAGLALARIRRVPFVLEVRDLWPESLDAVGLLEAGHPVVRGLEWLEHRLYRSAAGVVAVSEGFVDHLRRHGVPHSRLVVVENGIDLDAFRVDTPLDLRGTLGIAADTLLVGFVGTLGLAQDVGILARAVARLPEDAGIHVVIVGEGADRERVAREISALGVGSRVHLRPAVPRTEVPRLLQACDVCAVLLRDHVALDKVLPSKVFEAMAMGRPVLLGARGCAEALLRRADAGRSFTPGDVGGLLAALGELRTLGRSGRERLGASGRAYVLANHDRRRLTERLESFLVRTLASDAPV